MPLQDEIFLSEGDQWFKRQEGSLTVKPDDHVLAYLARSDRQSTRILEIGCSNGYRLQEIMTRYPGAEVSGTEISAMAVEDGKKRYPQLDLRQGASHDLSPFPDGAFDTVIVSFVFHWVDRSRLFKTVCEIDRVLAEGGRLLIRDFDPLYPCKTKYHHVSDTEVFTYKQPYWDLFLASRLYRTLFMEEFLHTKIESFENQQLCKFVVLEKRLEAGYPLLDL